MTTRTLRLNCDHGFIELEQNDADEWVMTTLDWHNGMAFDQHKAQVARLERELHDAHEALREEYEGGRIMTDALIRAESWAALWKRAATINRYDRAWGYWWRLRSWCATLSETPRRRALLRALGLCHNKEP